jgi:hypothetical protein
MKIETEPFVKGVDNRSVGLTFHNKIGTGVFYCELVTKSGEDATENDGNTGPEGADNLYNAEGTAVMVAKTGSDKHTIGARIRLQLVLDNAIGEAKYFPVKGHSGKTIGLHGNFSVKYPHAVRASFRLAPAHQFDKSVIMAVDTVQP